MLVRIEKDNEIWCHNNEYGTLGCLLEWCMSVNVVNWG